jgi:hypothetical protein
MKNLLIFTSFLLVVFVFAGCDNKNPDVFIGSWIFIETEWNDMEKDEETNTVSVNLSLDQGKISGDFLGVLERGDFGAIRISEGEIFGEYDDLDLSKNKLTVGWFDDRENKGKAELSHIKESETLLWQNIEIENIDPQYTLPEEMILEKSE